jgi:hypothetical protein
VGSSLGCRADLSLDTDRGRVIQRSPGPRVEYRGEEEKDILLHGNFCAYSTRFLLGDPEVSRARKASGVEIKFRVADGDSLGFELKLLCY